jgi:uncharacterized phiE125 gp8 family phage protein
MQLNTQLITPPTVEPVTLAQAKLHCRVDFTDDDALITAYITAARQYAEKYTGRAFFNQTWLRTLDFFPLYGDCNATRTPSQRHTWPYGTWYWDQVTIELPTPRTVSVTSITYLDNSGTSQTLPASAYTVDTTSVPARIVPTQGTFWPIIAAYQPGSVRITYVAGSYGDGATVNTCPQTIVMAMLLLIGNWYENRSSTSAQSLKAIPMGVDALLSLERVQIVGYR